MNVNRELVSCTPKKFFRVCQKQKKTQNISALGSSPFHLLGFLMEKQRQCFLGKDFGGGVVYKINKIIQQKVSEQSKPVWEITEVKLLGEADHTAACRRKGKLIDSPSKTSPQLLSPCYFDLCKVGSGLLPLRAACPQVCPPRHGPAKCEPGHLKDIPAGDRIIYGEPGQCKFIVSNGQWKGGKKLP